MSRATFIYGVIHGRKLWPNGVRRYRSESLSAIIHDTASKHGFTITHLVGKARTADIAKARHEAVLRAHETGKYSLSQIAWALGERDHTAIASSGNQDGQALAHQIANLKAQRLAEIKRSQQ